MVYSHNNSQFHREAARYLVFAEDPISLGNGHDVYPGTKSSADADILV
jgi:hypothetical protein